MNIQENTGATGGAALAPKLPNLVEAARFLRFLDPQADAFTFAYFDDNKTRKNNTLAGIRHGSLDILAGHFTNAQKAGCGIFVTVNRMDGNGRKTGNLVAIRAVFHEQDDVGANPEFPIRPHFTVESSPGKFHRYWLANGLDKAGFDAAMRCMVETHGSDPNAKDAVRVLRVPGFWHLKDPANPFQVRIVESTARPPYTAAEIIAAFPPPQTKAGATPARVDVLASTGPMDAATLRDLRSALWALRADAYATWVAVGLSLKTLGDQGRALWLDWSSTSDKFDAADAARRWEGFAPTCTDHRHIFKLAQEAGWVNPAAKKGRKPKSKPRDAVPNDEDLQPPDWHCEGLDGPPDEVPFNVLTGAEKKKPPISAPLVFFLNGDEEKPRLVKQSQAAAILQSKLDCLAFDPVQERWLNYSGNVWQRVSESKAFGVITETIDRNGGRLVGFDAIYPSGIAVFLKSKLSAEDFDSNPGLIPFSNGVLCGVTNEFRPHDKTHRLTWQLPFPYSHSGECLPVIQWLAESVGGDKGQVELLRAYIRAVMTGRADLQRYVEVVGRPGTGKGTFLRLVTALIGEKNVHVTTLNKLETNRFETANVYGKRLVQITDAEKYNGDTSTLQAMTGEDFLPYEAKHRQGGGSFRFGGMVLLAANDVTATGDYTGALHRRRITIRFDNAVDATQRRPLMDEFAPHLPGVIRWALDMPDDAMVALLRDTDRQVARVAESNLAMLLDVNPIAQWADERLVAAPGVETQVGVRRVQQISDNEGPDGKRRSYTEFVNADTWLYANYVEWCAQVGKKELAGKNFTRAVEAVLCQQLKLDGVRHVPNSNGKGSRFAGIRLRIAGDDAVPNLLYLAFSSFLHTKVWKKYRYGIAEEGGSTGSTENAQIYAHIGKSGAQTAEGDDPTASVGKKNEDEKKRTYEKVQNNPFCPTSSAGAGSSHIDAVLTYTQTMLSMGEEGEI